jgi:hypothetical protein
VFLGREFLQAWIDPIRQAAAASVQNGASPDDLVSGCLVSTASFDIDTRCFMAAFFSVGASKDRRLGESWGNDATVLIATKGAGATGWEFVGLNGKLPIFIRNHENRTSPESANASRLTRLATPCGDCSPGMGV